MTRHSLNQIFIEIENIHFFAISMLFRMNSTKIHGCPNDIYIYLHTKNYNSSVPEGKLMGVELIGVYKSGSINWG